VWKWTDRRAGHRRQEHIINEHCHAVFVMAAGDQIGCAAHLEDKEAEARKCIARPMTPISLSVITCANSPRRRRQPKANKNR
jgi:hypothetical protein